MIVNESYKDFVDGLQKETREALRERPTKADANYFEGKVVTKDDGDKQTISKSYKASKSIQDYVFIDGSADKSIEWKFAESLDKATEVCVYAKLPRTFKIPTPVGNYSPDWAIAFNKGTVKHIFFIAETKGTLSSLETRPIERAKIRCARTLFNEMSFSNVRYHDVDNFSTLLDIMKSID